MIENKQFLPVTRYFETCRHDPKFLISTGGLTTALSIRGSRHIPTTSVCNFPLMFLPLTTPRMV